MNWINSWREGNKKNIIDFTFRFGVLTLFELNWNPKKNFEAGLKETIEWYMKNQTEE